MSYKFITIHYHGYFSESEKKGIEGYLQLYPADFWRKNINVKKDSKTGLMLLNDGQKQHEIFEHECK